MKRSDINLSVRLDAYQFTWALKRMRRAMKIGDRKARRVFHIANRRPALIQKGKKPTGR